MVRPSHLSTPMKRASVLAAIIAAVGLQTARAVVITQPADPIGGGQANGETTGSIFTIGGVGSTGDTWPAAEAPGFAIDGLLTTKYLNFGKTLTGYVVTPSAGPSIVTGLFLSTANDSPARDPFTFSLFGSNSVTASNVTGTVFNLSNFTQIVLDASTNLTTDPGRNTADPTQPTFANSTAYTTYLLVFPTVRDAASANSMQIGEAELTGTLVPEPSSGVLLGLASLGCLARRRRPAV